MVLPLPPTEHRPLASDEKLQVLDRVDELLELRYRTASLREDDEQLLDALVHLLLTRGATSRQAHEAGRDLLMRWRSWDEVRAADADQLTARLAQYKLKRPRVRQVQELLERVHNDTLERGWHGTTLKWLTPDIPGHSVQTTINYLATLPNLTPQDASRLARNYTGDDLLHDPRAGRVLRRLALTTVAEPARRQPATTPSPAANPTNPDVGNGEGTLDLPRRVSAEVLRRNLIHHSRVTCHPKNPDCSTCPLISFCAIGRANNTGDGRPVAVEAFAGGGGLGEGLRQAGFDVAVAVELDRDAAQTYRSNHPGTVVVEADATTITGNELRFLAPRVAHATVLAAGPPCQGYSAAGRRQADDDRNNLYTAVVALAAQLTPRFVVIENVPGMRRVGGESYVQAVLDALQDVKYNSSESLLRASDYGVPQLRRRMIFLAQHIDFGDAPAPPPPTHCVAGVKCTHPRGDDEKCVLPAVPTVLESLESSGLPELDAGQLVEFLALGNGQAPITNASTMAHSPAVVAKMADIVPGAGPISYRRLHPDIARTIVAGHRALPVHPTLNRTISVREAARIQGFPDEHVFAGSRSKQPLQVANAVPPALGRAIAEQLLREMRSNEEPAQPCPTAEGTVAASHVNLPERHSQSAPLL